VQTVRPSDNGAVFSRAHCSHPIKTFLADHKPAHFAIRREQRRSKPAQKPLEGQQSRFFAPAYTKVAANQNNRS
jgi:hypothetical protein